MTENDNVIVIKRCEALDCKKRAREDSAFCSDECREATGREGENNPHAWDGIPGAQVN